MRRLGYDRYAAQGGDFGALISLTLTGLHPEHVVGVHVNFLPTLPSAIHRSWRTSARRTRLAWDGCPGSSLSCLAT